MRRSAIRLSLIGALLWTGFARAEPVFPWTTFQTLAAEASVRDLYECREAEHTTHVTELLIFRPAGFYRLWTMLHGAEWIAIHYDREARPDWVWRGTWFGDLLSVVSGSSYDQATHLSACDLLFQPRP